MSQVYTPEFFQNIQSNLNTFVSVNPSDDALLSNKEFNKDKLTEEYKSYDNHYFQALIFDGDLEKLQPEKYEDHFKLVYGTKENLEGYLGLNPDKLSFPTRGVEVKSDFVSPSGESTQKAKIANAEHATVRFLLQSRRLSQITASTWLKTLTTEQKLIKQIFDNYNARPKVCTISSKKKPTDVDEKDFEDEKYKKQPFIIKRDSLSYNAISLVLLLSGQAYYKCRDKDEDDKDKYKLIGESIFSTYEMIWEYAIDLSWDTFYARREDISQASKHPNPPFTKVILGYPPIPNESAVSQAQISNWVTAKDGFEQEEQAKKPAAVGRYPFYPQKDTDEWRNLQLKFIVPPYPYLPLSCL